MKNSESSQTFIGQNLKANGNVPIDVNKKKKKLWTECFHWKKQEVERVSVKGLR